MDPTGQSCEAANAFSNINIIDNLCMGVLNRTPKFAFNPKNLNSDKFCQFFALFPIGNVAGRSTCNAIVDCVVRNIQGKHGNLGKECGTDILKGFVNNVEKSMSEWTNTLSGIASIANDELTNFLETVGCGKDPSPLMSESISAIAKIIEGLTNYHSQLETMFEILPEIMELSPEEFYNSLGTDDDKEKDYFSFLMGPGMSIQIGRAEISKNLGVFVTVPIEELKRCASSVYDKSKIGDCLRKMDIYEIGIYEASGAGLTSSFGVSADVSKGMEFLHGTSNKWGGFGFGISIGGGPKFGVAKVEASFGLVFSALESGGRQYMDELIGFNVYIKKGAGPEDPTPVTVSVNCALAKVSTPQKCKKPEPPKCPNLNLKEQMDKLKKTGEQMGQDWEDLYNTCKAHWVKKWKKCENPADNRADAIKGCAKGFSKKCVSFKSDYCPGKMKEAMKTCASNKYHKVRGKCEAWNKKCGKYGRKRVSCNSWNSRKRCSLQRQKKTSCKSWNTKKHCRRYGQKKHCDWVRKGTRWASIPYPCGTNWCKRGWFRFPCGVRICHRNLAKAIMGWSCKMVTDAANCVRHSVQYLGCRAWNMVPECVRHQVEKISCRSWRFVRDTSRCLTRVVDYTSCKTWDMIDDVEKCVGGWTHIPRQCMDDVVGHCSKWEETCTENLMANDDMFKNCGLNMLPYVPA